MPASPNHQNPDYTRKSETESICMFCYATVRSSNPAPLRLAEDVHAQVCYVRHVSLSRESATRN